MIKAGQGIKRRASWVGASFALLLGCSGSDGREQQGDAVQDLRGHPITHPGRPSPKPIPGHGPGHGHGHGHGHGDGSGSGSGGASSTGNGGTSSATAGSASGGGLATAGTSVGAGAGGMGWAGSAGAPGSCGDGQPGWNESCDDGNVVSGDGCSSDCTVEPYSACERWGEACHAVICGDGRQDGYMREDGSWAAEACDDGNTASGDGCSSTCESVESGWLCDQPGQACRKPVCGDGLQDSWFVPDAGAAGSGSGGFGGGPSGTFNYEQCDDGNTVSGDGCSSACVPESGWVCPEPGAPCHRPVCGDGIVDFIATSGQGGSGGFGGGPSSGYFEPCDDGNTLSGDGCSPTCTVEPGYSCNGWVPGCHLIVCGDGLVDYPDEDCDDGNTTPNDGCTQCRYDQGGFGGAGGFTSGGFGGMSAGTSFGGSH